MRGQRHQDESQPKEVRGEDRTKQAETSGTRQTVWGYHSRCQQHPGQWGWNIRTHFTINTIYMCTYCIQYT